MAKSAVLVFFLASLALAFADNVGNGPPAVYQPPMSMAARQWEFIWATRKILATQ
jgi:hypothetical protein